jgi:WD40 repeat protein
LPPGEPPEWVDLKRDSAPVPLQEIGTSTNVLGWFSTNLLCHWDGTNQIRIRELRGMELIQRGAITLNSGSRPTGFAYNPARQLLAWTEGTSSNSVYLASLAAPSRRIELKSDVHGLVRFRFSEDGNYLAAATTGGEFLRTWNVETRQIVASSDGLIRDATFAAGGRVLVLAIDQGKDHEIGFYDLAHPGRVPRRVPGRNASWSLAVSPDGGLVVSSTLGGEVRLFDPTTGELIDSLHGHLNAAFGIAFSADGRRLISASGGREAVKLWDVGTRQELLTLGGTGSLLVAARWSADGDVILAGPQPWQAWRAPSWEEIAAAEAKEKAEIQRP